MYETVYDPKGEPFEVVPYVAERLVVFEGWSRTPPAAPLTEPSLFDAAVTDDGDE